MYRKEENTLGCILLLGGMLVLGATYVIPDEPARYIIAGFGGVFFGTGLYILVIKPYIEKKFGDKQ